MAQAARNTGRTKDGGTERCSLCNSRLELIDGTDPEKAQHGFVEEYECKSCGAGGTLVYNAETHTTQYTGACADY